MFANNSAYQTNLNALFNSLSSNATNNPSGYYQTTVGDPTNEVIYGHYVCRGDLNTSMCHECVTNTTTTYIPKTYCPNRKNALIWSDYCMVRYSNVSFFDQMDTQPQRFLYRGGGILGNATMFSEILGNLMNNVISAARGGQFEKFGVDAVNSSIPDEPILSGYGLCTADLTSDDCYKCLSFLQGSFVTDSMGGAYAVSSCMIRYEVYPFLNPSYKIQHLPLLPALQPSPGPPMDLNPTFKPIASNGSKTVSRKLFVSIVAPLLVLLAALLSICICLLKYKRKKVKMACKYGTDVDQDFTAESLEYDLQTLLTATSNFSDEKKLGEGGFGAVYKGILPNGKLIAVKRLSATSNQGIHEFKTEVLVVAKLQHRNLVRLLGFCYTRQEKLLVYEHVANKSLDNFLFVHENRRQLSWQTRYNIIRGIARGLLYLHHESQVRVIHRDLKASNVLLDEEMNPKISDFGTSRIFGVEHSQSNYTNQVVGTFGYMAPEYALHGKFSIKSDTYSFGVLILEIISGRKNSTYNDPIIGDEGLLSYFWRQWEAGTPSKCVDPTIRDSCANSTDVLRCIQVGLLCVQESIENRPTMANVVLTLDSYSVTLPMPEKSNMYDGICVELILSKNGGEDQSSNKSKAMSINEDSITELEPR